MKSGDNLLLPDMSTPSHFPQQLFLLLISYRDKNEEEQRKGLADEEENTASRETGRWGMLGK